MFVSKKKVEEMMKPLLESQLTHAKQMSKMLELLQHHTMKIAGLEAILDRLERDGPERTGVDRFMH